MKLETLRQVIRAMNRVYEIITDTSLDYKDKRHLLAAEAENSLPYVKISEKAQNYFAEGILCDLFEGHAPYRPRYILPDYQKFMEKGSEYLNLKPPQDLFEAVNALLIIYRYVPSITSYPVYLGQVDELLEPFVLAAGEELSEKLLKMFLVQIDRVLPDGFVHMNIGPKDTRTGRLLLKLERELKQAVPNISLKYNEETPDSFAIEAVKTALEIGKPYFVNDRELKEDLDPAYGVASCYNTLLIGGGSFTLVRLNLKEAAKKARDFQDFIRNVLPDAVLAQAEVINARAKFIVEEAKFFETSFLAKEGLISLARFTSMAGYFGLYECLEHLTGLKLGKDKEALDYAEQVLKTAKDTLESVPGAYCYGTGGRIGFHAQSGIDSDIDVTPGVRIKYGEEPDIFTQIKTIGPLHKYFNTGISDIYIFDRTARENPEGVLKIIKGALKEGIRVFSFNTSDSEFIRITGYLVKRTDVLKYEKGEVLREDTVKLGAASIKNNNTEARKVRIIGERNSQ
ncbi:YjjI family glycine radical enzyme [Carboxydothermus ferrireducens]|uniref:YjjI family glycine radical enzyme n=1 Tax=Carboxydothermus ferrireducens DSM 11255 TaxID=1119529 RepID=A0ABX2RA99_9THEO|nr:YjjI family glycine radical enzyme [Carboxydothermus ferrireducens]NYE56787.1 YjjI family glycine radical enzyme [Carboxydothermus ferrireducens DSM 11255]